MTQGQFLSGLHLVCIQSFLSLKLVALPKLKNPFIFAIYPYIGEQIDSYLSQGYWHNVKCKKKKKNSSRIWTWFAESIFFDVNRYTPRTFNSGLVIFPKATLRLREESANDGLQQAREENVNFSCYWEESDDVIVAQVILLSIYLSSSQGEAHCSDWYQLRSQEWTFLATFNAIFSVLKKFTQLSGSAAFVFDPLT